MGFLWCCISAFIPGKDSKKGGQIKECSNTEYDGDGELQLVFPATPAQDCNWAWQGMATPYGTLSRRSCKLCNTEASCQRTLPSARATEAFTRSSPTQLPQRPAQPTAVLLLSYMNYMRCVCLAAEFTHLSLEAARPMVHQAGSRRQLQPAPQPQQPPPSQPAG